MNVNSVAAWERLLRFPTRCLRVPPRSCGRGSLASRVKKQLTDETDPVPVPAQAKRGKVSRNQHTEEDALQGLGRRVASKLEDGDIRGAVRLASSDDRLAPLDPATYAALEAKHPSPHCDTIIPPPPHPVPAQVEAVAVVRAIRSFPNGSAGGPDLLRPQHLKDIL